MRLQNWDTEGSLEAGFRFKKKKQRRGERYLKIQTCLKSILPPLTDITFAKGVFNGRRLICLSCTGYGMTGIALYIVLTSIESALESRNALYRIGNL